MAFRYFANSVAVRLPSGIARHVLGVVGLTSTVRLHRDAPDGRADHRLLTGSGAR